MGTYEKTTYCTNCDQIVTVYIPKGTQAIGYSCRCPLCECKGVLEGAKKWINKKR